MILEGIIPRNTFDSITPFIRMSAMLVAFGSTVWFLKISSVSTPTDPGLEKKKERKKVKMLDMKISKLVNEKAGLI